mmetsp:Transcript_51734/g.155257  ORF Transcript_51734/g.155257 Transcript_51734/m.155257 type:complete len:266 (+) Transcript_51734:259-1056(+)
MPNRPHALCEFDAYKRHVLDGLRTEGVESSRRYPERPDLRIRLHPDEASHIYVVPVQILGARAERGGTRHGPWRGVAPTASPEFQPVRDDEGDTIHVLLVYRGRIRRGLHHLLALPILPLEGLPPLHERPRLERHRLHEARGYDREAEGILVSRPVLRLEHDTHGRRVVEGGRHFHEEEELRLRPHGHRTPPSLSVPVLATFLEQPLRPLLLHPQVVTVVYADAEPVKGSRTEVAEEDRYPPLRADVFVLNSHLEQGVLEQHTRG